MRYIYITTILFLNVLITFASFHNKIKGIVFVENDNPLVGANVVWLNTTIGASNYSAGRFEIENVLDDDYAMLV